MTKKLKLPIGILTVLAVFLAALLFLPLGATDGFVITASAEAVTITPSQPTGDGSVGSPYQIGTAAELYWFAAQVNSGSTTINAVLTANITVNTGVLKADGSFTALDGFTSWTPIGNSSNQYTGTFNGNDHTVSGLFFYNTSTDYVGLFGYIGSGGRVSNVGVVESCLYGADYVGGISGRNYGAIESCYNASFISSDNSQPYIGGVCGKNYGTIKNCYNRGKAFLCGVCGENYNGTLENCYNAGTLMSGSGSKRGVCGSNTGTITNCYFLNTSETDVNAIGKSAEEFASGEVAYLLQGEQETAVWGQNIDNGAEIQAYPVLGGAKVYHGYAENDPSALIYSNSELNEDTHVHSYENGFCKVCSNYDAAAKNNSGVYEISNAGQLYWFAHRVNSGDINIKAILTQDITVNNGDVAGCKGTKAENWKEWTPIGNNSSRYTGTFDGNNKTISGLYFNNAQASYVGLFGYIENSGSVSDVGVINSYINGNEKVGGVCGHNGGTITSCYNTGTVSGTGYTGGVCGYNKYGTIKSCYNTGAVSGTGTYIGGVCGENYGTIENSYNTGAVSSKASYVGGVCGEHRTGTVVNCYNTGAVSGDEEVGGVCGSLGGTIANCYFDSTAYSGIAVGTIIDGVVSGNVLGKATAKFTGGEVAYLLWQGCTVNEVTYDGSVWGQTIGTDLSPVFSGAKVYPCTEGCLAKYANTEGATGEHTAPDTYDNGFGKCTDCDADLYQPATSIDGVYQIGNAGQLYWFADKVNNDNANFGSANAKLTANITVNTGDVAGCNGKWQTGWRDWESIGKTDTNPYKGTFDGNGFYVSGLYFYNSSTDYVGLFGYNMGKITNVGVVNSYFKGKQYVGGVCGFNDKDHNIQNCYNTGAVSGTSSNSSYIGGVCGQNCGTITNCYNTGTVSGTSSSSFNIGGVCGSNAYSGTITNCYNTGTVSGKGYYVGGVCGNNSNTIKNSYNTGTVSGSFYVSGVCGYIDNGTITNCYYLECATFDSINGTSKTAEQFASGEVAYLLQGTQTTDVWGQTLTVENKQNYPVLGGAPVYKCTKGCTAKHSNEQDATGKHTAPDTYDKDGFGKCKDCNADVYQPATQNESGIYEISNAGQLYWFAQQVNGGNTTINAELTDNITVNSDLLSSLQFDDSGNITSDTSGFRSWTPIGNQSKPYTGTFDGDNKTISGLYFNDTDTSYVGLFGYIGSGGRVSNVGVVDSYFKGQNYVGGVFGYSSSGTIENCYNAGTISGASNVGGVCGYASATIKNCYNKGAVSGESYVGGVCGKVSYCRIFNCYNTGTVNGTGSNIGSVCGNDYNLVIKNCYYLAETETDSIDGTTAKSATQFGSGEVAYLLSLGCTTNTNTYSGEVWGQDLSTTTNYPVLDSTKKVYLTTPCPSYTNTANETKEHKDGNEDGVCDVCNAKFAYIVSLISEAEGVSSVANPSGGGKFNTGDKTTITAEALPGYTFNGWYKDDEATAYCTDLSFEYTPTADVTFTAKYTANAEMAVTIDGGESYSVSVNGGTPNTLATKTTVNYAVGTKLTVTAMGDNFAYWENEAGSVLSRNAEYTFTVVNSATVTAVYNTPVENKAIVNFISGYDQVINRYQITAAEAFTVPSAPTKTGCDFAGWSINGGAAVTENVAEAVKAAIKAALETAETTDDVINVKATYNAKVQDVTITVTNGTGGGTYNINTIVTVTANDPAENMKFSHWTDGTNTLSYNTSYSFYAAKDIALTAVYVEDTAVVEAKGTTEMVSATRANGVTTFVSLSTVPKGCAIVKAGVIVTNVAADSENLTEANAKYVRGDAWSGTTYRYSLNITTSKTYYAKAYLVYTDKNGNTQTVYGNLVTVTP